MAKQKLMTARVTVPVWRQVTETTPTSSSTRSVGDGQKSATVELWIDLDALLGQLGAKALRSKSLRSKLHDGDIEARVVGPITRTPNQEAGND
jgi:hypothetical protein